MATANDVVNWMLSKVGIRESPMGSNNVSFNTEYYGGAVSGSAYAWCQAMIWCCFKSLGILDLYGTKSAYTVFVASAFNQQGRFHRDNPKPGDMVFFDWGGSKNISAIDHVGIVISVNADGSVNTVEGNVSNQVMKMRRTMQFIVGFGRPAYGSSSSSSNNSNSSPISTGTEYTIKSGDTLWAIAQSNSTTVSQLKEWNNLTSDTIFVGQKLVVRKSSTNATSSEAILTVRSSQTWFNTFVFNSIGVDNIAGQATLKAFIKIVQYELNIQYNAGLVVDGVVGPKTIAAWRNLSRGAKGNLTKVYQCRLIQLGISIGNAGADGDFGSGTASGTITAQNRFGIPADSIAGKGTFTKIAA